MTDIQRKHTESRMPEMPEITKIETALLRAYPEEVTQLLTKFDKLPPFSQDVAKKVLVTIPQSIAANDEKFSLAA